MIKALNYYSAVGEGDGYSNSAEQYIVAMNRLTDVTVKRLGYERPVGDDCRNVLAKGFKTADVGIVHDFPANFGLMKNEFRVGFTMFETTKLPTGADWAGNDNDPAKQINDNCDMLFVPSQDSRLTFMRHGVTVPIHIAHNGIREGQFPYVNRQFGRNINKPFTFLMLGTLTTRKNTGLVISAFIDLHKQMPNAKLILKTQSGTHAHIEFDKEACGDIEIIDEVWSDKNVSKLMAESDCFVFPTHGEGFGMPPLEAMATGMPTIIAANSGMLEYANPKYNWAVKSIEMSEAQRYPTKWGDVGLWWNPDLEDLKKHMLYVYENQHEAFAKGKLASEWVHKEFNYGKIAKDMLDAIESEMGAV